jgi:hypothetical protein
MEQALIETSLTKLSSRSLDVFEEELLNEVYYRWERI